MKSHWRPVRALHGGAVTKLMVCERVAKSTPTLTPKAKLKADLAVLKAVDLDQAYTLLQAREGESENPWAEQAAVDLLRRHGGHRHIVRHVEHFEMEGQRVFVMEYCGGGDLVELLEQDKRGRLDEAQVVGLMRGVVDALSFLHRIGIAHRDVSLENLVMTARQDVCKVIDFGLSTSAREPAREQVGKKYYMAPEVVSRERYDPCKADVWSLGVVLFVLLTGSPPFQIANESDTGFRAMKKYGIGAIIEVWGMQGEISISMLHLISRMLAVDPSHRPTMAVVQSHAVFQ